MHTPYVFPRSLYHLTHPENWFRIAVNGLQVAHDARKVGRVWFCSAEVLDSVARHLTLRDGRWCALYVVLKVKLTSVQPLLKRSGKHGVFYVERDIHPSRLERCGQMFIDCLERDSVVADSSAC